MNAGPDPEVVVFNAALQLPADKRGAYLDLACAGDADLRRRVECLLEANEAAAEDFLKGKPMNQRPAAKPGPEQPAGTMRITPAAGEKQGDRIGRYKVLQEIGEGGCGAVYMAQQEEPVRRRVA